MGTHCLGHKLFNIHCRETTLLRLLDMDMATAMERLSWSWGGRSWQLNLASDLEASKGNLPRPLRITGLLCSLLTSSVFPEDITHPCWHKWVWMQFYWAQDPNCSALQVTSTPTSLIKIRTCTASLDARNPGRRSLEVWMHCSIPASYTAILKCLQGRG